jgi:mRNA interferase MazF
VAVVNRAPRRDEVWLVSLDPTHGAEIQKTRPCLVVSPDEMNRYLQTVIVVPMTTTMRRYPTRVPLRFQGKSGQAALDQLRAVDRQRLVRKLGTVSPSTAQQTSAVLLEIFSR